MLFYNTLIGCKTAEVVTTLIPLTFEPHISLVIIFRGSVELVETSKVVVSPLLKAYVAPKIPDLSSDVFSPRLVSI